MVALQHDMPFYIRFISPMHVCLFQCSLLNQLVLVEYCDHFSLVSMKHYIVQYLYKAGSMHQVHELLCVKSRLCIDKFCTQFHS